VKSNKLKLEEVYNILKLRKENEIAKMKLQQAEIVIKQCTFQPNLEKRAKSPAGPSNPLERSRKLHQEAYQRQMKMKNKEENKKDIEWEKNQNECTFSPKAVSRLNEKVFEKNPIENDKLTKKRIDQMEKARIEKKLNEYKVKRGLNKIKANSNIQDIIKEDNFPSMKYGIEHKTYKDTFDNRKKQSKTASAFSNATVKKQSLLNSVNSRNNTEGNMENNENMNSMSMNSTIRRSPIILFEVNVKENVQERLEIFDIESAFKVCDAFCLKFGLPDEKKEFLYKLINEKIYEIT